MDAFFAAPDLLSQPVCSSPQRAVHTWPWGVRVVEDEQGEPEEGRGEEEEAHRHSLNLDCLLMAAAWGDGGPDGALSKTRGDDGDGDGDGRGGGEAGAEL